MKRLCVLVSLAAFLALSTPRIGGQEPGSDPLYEAQGFQPGRDYLSELPFEHIDTMTGNVLLTFTDLSLPGNAGFDLEIVRAYNSKAPAGWTFGLTGYPYRIDNPNGVPGNIDPFTTDARPYFPRLRMPDGSRPELFSEDQYSFAVFRTQQFWRYQVSGRRLQVPDGTEAFYSATGLLSYVQDPFGNRINVTYTNTGNLLRMEQLLGGQTRYITFDSGAPGTVPGRMIYEGREWRYFSWDGDSLYQVTPPAGPSWEYQYAGGMLAAVVTPHGGRVEYGFTMGLFGRDVGPAVQSRVLSTRRTAGARLSTPGSWSYSYSWRLGDSTTVTGPDNTRSVFEYTKPGGASEPALRAVTRNGGENEVRAYQVRPITNWGGGSRALLSSRSMTRDGRTYTTTLSYGTGNFEDYGRANRVQESGTFQRTTTYTFDYGFDSSRWIKDRVASRTVAMDGQSFAISHEYDGTTGFLESVTRYGITTFFVADAAGNVQQTSDAHGHVTRYTYEWGVVKDTITPSHTIARTINVDGTIASETRGAALTWFDYDALGRRTRVSPSLGHPIETQYNTASVRERRSDGASAGGRTTATTSFLDGFGRATGTENTQGVKTSIRYDALGRKVFESLPFEGSAEVGTAYTYDELGRVLTMQKNGAPLTNYGYGLGGTVTIAEQNFPETRVTVQQWGAFGDPSDRLLIGVTDANGSSWTYRYNGLGLLTGVDGGREWVYYPGTDRLQYESHPESGLTSYTYDAAGLLWLKGSPRGTFTHSYDGNHRLTGIASTYLSHNVTIGYDAADNRTSLRNSYVSSEFRYDRANRLEVRNDLIEGDVRETRYRYSNWDEVIGIEYPSMQSVTYGYDSEGRPRTVSRNGGAVPVADALAYHPGGAIKTLRMGNGITEQFEFDANRYWPTTITGGPVSLTYQYDQVGNVSFITNHTNASLNQEFRYDRLDRVTTISNFGWNGFEYDRLGNRIWKQAGGLTYHYDLRNRLAMVTGPQPNPEVGAYTFDQAGGLAGDPSGIYTYTPFDMLERATVGGTDTVYRYDGDNQRRIRHRHNGPDVFYYGMGGQLLSEWTAGAWVRDYIYLGNRLVASLSERVLPRSPISSADYDADGRTDLAIFRPASAEWWILKSGTDGDFPPSNYVSYQWGIPGDIPVRADYDADGKADLAVWRPSNATWYVRYSATSYDYASYCQFGFGVSGDIPVPADFTGDGRADLAVWRPSTGEWFVLPSGSSRCQYTYTNMQSYQWGLPGDKPVPGDYDGDRKVDLAVFRPGEANWYIRWSSQGYSYSSYTTQQWGLIGDVATPGDFNGDGRWDLAIWRPSTGGWWVKRSQGTAFEAEHIAFLCWGAPTDVPVLGDYDGDGKMDPAVWRPSDAGWYVRPSGPQCPSLSQPLRGWGLSSDTPLPGNAQPITVR